jgi:LysR family transcriptional regulator, nitrogen assimilation regulatory protein
MACRFPLLLKTSTRMDLRQLRYFLHAAKAENITQASSKAWISQSAISRQIKLLEAELGVLLFERRARGVKLTDAGVALVRRAELLLQDADDLQHDVRATKKEPTGTLRIGTPTSLRTLLLVPFIVQYHLLYPNVLIVHRHGTSKSMRDALAEGDLDIAITSDTEALDPFIVKPMLSEALCLVGPTGARLRADRPVSVKRIAAHSLILTSYPNSLRALVDRALTKTGHSVSPIVEADSADMMLDLVHKGLGYTVLPFSALQVPLVERYVSASPVQKLNIRWVVARSRERAQTLAIQRAIELLDEICRTKVSAREWPTAKIAKHDTSE